MVRTTSLIGMWLFLDIKFIERTDLGGGVLLSNKGKTFSKLEM